MSPTMVATSPAVASAWIAELRNRVESIRNDLMAEVAVAMEDSLQAGESAAHARIEGAITDTGRAREKRGGDPGRIETGAFNEGFTHGVEQVDENNIQGRFGWIGDDNPKYFEYQEGGTAKIEDVHALLDSSEVAKGEFKKRLTDYVRKEFS